LNIEVVDGEGTTDPKPGSYREKEDSDVSIEVIPDEDEGEEVLSFEVNGENKRAELMNPPAYEYVVTITEDTTVEVEYFCPI